MQYNDFQIGDHVIMRNNNTKNEIQIIETIGTTTTNHKILITRDTINKSHIQSWLYPDFPGYEYIYNKVEKLQKCTDQSHPTDPTA